jgi:hypothetical protein
LIPITKGDTAVNIYRPIQNKYCQWYQNLVTKAKERVLDDTVYQEKHHIIPKCFGGNDLPTNLVSLTLREHYIAHLLLSKMYVGEAKRKMMYALWRMLLREKTRGSRTFEMYREQYIKTTLNTQVITDEFRQKVSNSTKGIKKTITQKVLDKNKRLKVELSGTGNPMYGKKQTDNAKLLISKKLSEHYKNPENRKKQALTRIGSKHSESVKEEMSKKRSGAGNAMFGRKHSEETRRKISEAGKKRYERERQENINRL